MSVFRIHITDQGSNYFNQCNKTFKGANRLPRDL